MYSWVVLVPLKWRNAPVFVYLSSSCLRLSGLPPIGEDRLPVFVSPGYINTYITQHQHVHYTARLRSPHYFHTRLHNTTPTIKHTHHNLPQAWQNKKTTKKLLKGRSLAHPCDVFRRSLRKPRPHQRLRSQHARRTQPQAALPERRHPSSEGREFDGAVESACGDEAGRDGG